MTTWRKGETPAERKRRILGLPNEERKDRTYELFVVAAIVVVLLGTVGWWVLSSSQEARAFNRLTGGEATTWDAMFVELRVIEPAEGGNGG